MSRSYLSPLFLGGVVLSLMPRGLVDLALDIAAGAVARRHPGVGKRLSHYSQAVVIFELDNLPARFALQITPQRPRLSLANTAELANAAATIRGSLSALIELLEGRADGDALFFARRLHIEGNMDVVVALRNALDGEDIDMINDALGLIGPLASPIRQLLSIRNAVRGGAGRSFTRVADRLSDSADTLFCSGLPDPATSRIDLDVPSDR